MMSEMPDQGDESCEYDVPRGTCPRCDSRVVRHLIIGEPTGPVPIEASPTWVSWVGCMHPGHDRECDGCGFAWSARQRPHLRSDQLSLDDVGAWILKCDPARWDIAGSIRDGESTDSWSITDNYRQHLLLPGQRVFLYVGGTAGAMTTGIYGSGEVIDDPFVGVGDELWANVQDGEKKRIFVPLDMPPLRLLASREKLKAQHALANMELFSAPKMGNPVVVRPEEVGAIDALAAGRAFFA